MDFDTFCPHCADMGSLGLDPDGERVYCDCRAGIKVAKEEEDRLDAIWQRRNDD